MLCIKRQNIIKNAINKYEAFREILDDIGQIKHCLIYCSPEQMDTAQDLLNEKGIIQHKFTLHEGTRPEEKYGGLSEREFLLRKFAEGTYLALVAMRCLDEGVDVPPAKMAVILASSGIPGNIFKEEAGSCGVSQGRKEQLFMTFSLFQPFLDQ